MDSTALLNRSLISVFFKPDFLDLIKPYFEDQTITLEDLNSDPVMLLVPALTEQESEQEIAALHEMILEAVFNMYLEDPAQAPDLTKNFEDYFDIDFYEDVYDMVPEYQVYAEGSDDADLGQDLIIN